MLVNNRKIIQNIYGGRLQEKCQQCNTGIIFHPALDFHHPYPKLKTQHIRFGHGKWEKARETLEMEMVNFEWKTVIIKTKLQVIIISKNRFNDSIGTFKEEI
ncbi:hypothetical protein LCGC14_0385770 [marine sediment metagenome]|uniref:Uncharacterized protein n=1 Tax=marine sediment metagenome TaxID=412755 RepID=A0A0F9T6Y2_9ZZZZ|nr:MAG: hypothetical protein Lokiarch_33950 [Candidatus Lokiarchaeum sp. GC14_75]